MKDGVPLFGGPLQSAATPETDDLLLLHQEAVELMEHPGFFVADALTVVFGAMILQLFNQIHDSPASLFDPANRRVKARVRNKTMTMRNKKRK